MDYIIIVIIATLITGFLSGFVLGKLLGMGLKEQLVLGNFFLLLTALTIEIIVLMTGYKI